ncbi:hypothetical protein HME01_32980 [Vreelandella aquamarina]|nr:hypothetical protein HME01_32980 [Halomonas meridiana]
MLTFLLGIEEPSALIVHARICGGGPGRAIAQSTRLTLEGVRFMATDRSDFSIFINAFYRLLSE